MKNRWILLLVSCLLLAAYAGHEVWENRYERWVFFTGGIDPGPPTVCQDGTVLAGSNTTLSALDAATGKPKWTFRYPSPGIEYPPGIPVAGGDNTVYFGCEVNGHGNRLYARNGFTGKVKWSTGEDDPPLIDADHRLFAGSRQLIALDDRTGRRQWTFHPPHAVRKPGIGEPTDGSIEATACAQDMIFAAYGSPDNQLYALDAATGKRKWSVPLSGFHPLYDRNLAVTASGLVVVGESDGSIHALNESTGHLEWRFQTASSFSVSLKADRDVYVGAHEGNLFALDETTGNVKWGQRVGAKIGTLALDKSGTLIVGTMGLGSGIYALDKKTGQTTWSFSFGWLTHSFPYGENIGVSAGANGMVYATSTDGKLYALRRP